MKASKCSTPHSWEKIKAEARKLKNFYHSSFDDEKRQLENFGRGLTRFKQSGGLKEMNSNDKFGKAGQASI